MWQRGRWTQLSRRIRPLSPAESTAAGVARLLDSLRPFDSDEQQEAEFEQLFDGVEIVPQRFEQQDVAQLMNDAFIGANAFLVSISRQKFAMLSRRGLVRRAQGEGRRGAWVARLRYDDEQGFVFDEDMGDPD
jgi:CRISPR-associated endonuclease/helicase Cas3